MTGIKSEQIVSAKIKSAPGPAGLCVAGDPTAPPFPGFDPTNPDHRERALQLGKAPKLAAQRKREADEAKNKAGRGHGRKG